MIDRMNKKPEQPRIFYFSRHFGHPAGGVRTAYSHVRVLRSHGFEASILLTTERRDDFAAADVPVSQFQSGMTLSANDIVVIPEGWHEYIRSFGASPIRTFVFCQNHFYAHEGLGDARTYSDLGVERVFCGSDYIAKGLAELQGDDGAPVVTYAIDPILFTPGKKRRQIAFMPRKRREEAKFIRENFPRLFPQHASVPWTEIENMTEPETAAVLGESAIFLALGRLEGLGLPPLEAMSSGCLVTGFLANGGVEYGVAGNGLWCDAEDWSGAMRSLARALELLDSEQGKRMIDAGRRTAAWYSPDRMKNSLLAFWRDAADRE